MLIYKDRLLEKMPAPIHDPGTGLDLEGCFRLVPGQFAGDDPHAVKAFPLPCPETLTPFFQYLAMQTLSRSAPGN